MSTEIGKEMSSAVGQQTPVIVKTGGNGPVDIESPHMSFMGEFPGKPTWEVSVSTSRKKIRKLTIIEGGDKQDVVQPDSEMGAVIRIEYGSEKLFVNDTGDPLSSDVHMVIESTIPFNVTTPGEREGLWKASTSTTTFPPISRLRFTANGKVLLDRRFTGQSKVELHVF